MPAVRGARPIRNREVKEFYESLTSPKDVSLLEYESVFRAWINYSNNKHISGLEKFKYADYTQGTSQTFDNFIMRHSRDRTITVLDGDFQYHACQGKHVMFEYVPKLHPEFLQGVGLHALIISAPFSDFGTIHPEFEYILDICEMYNIPVCIDLAYWGIAKHVYIDLDKWNCIEEVTCSLSKPFFTLENHRVGIRFTKRYVDDGISMLNEVKMQNTHSMWLGVEHMKSFGPDYNWDKYQTAYEQVCSREELFYTDTVIFGLGDEVRHKEFNRGVPGNYRVCVSEWLNDC